MTPALFAASALLSFVSWAGIAHQILCLGAPMPADVRIVGEGTSDGERTWMPVGERCTWTTATGGTVTTTHHELGDNVGLYGGAAGMLASVALFMVSAKLGDDETRVPARRVHPR